MFYWTSNHNRLAPASCKPFQKFSLIYSFELFFPIWNFLSRHCFSPISFSLFCSGVVFKNNILLASVQHFFYQAVACSILNFLTYFPITVFFFLLTICWRERTFPNLFFPHLQILCYVTCVFEIPEIVLNVSNEFI